MEFLEVPLFDDDVFKLLVRLGINLLVVAAVVFGCYRRFHQNGKYLFTFMTLNIMVFFICFALKKLELELGLALGLFAIFGIIRYRTESIGAHEMTYLFVVVGIAVINALSNKKTSYVELGVTNGIIIFATFLLERISVARQTTENELSKLEDETQTLVYDNLPLLSPSRRVELLADIQNRTGLDVELVEIGKIDLLKGTTNLTIRCKPDNGS